MYIDDVSFQPVTNREDFYRTVQLVDDDFGTEINISGVSTPNPGIPFTSSAWTVTDGAVITPSATRITIPAYPFGNQLSALALTVGTNLGILPGDPVTIVDSATGLNQMTGYVTSYAPATGALVAQIGVTFEFEIRRGTPNQLDQDYVAWYDFGTPNSEQPLISAQLGNGITFIDLGTILIMIPAAIMQQLHRHTYTAALTMTDSINTRQVFVGELPVLYGGTNTVPTNITTPPSWAAEF
jgi:hypothetical protein